MLTHNEHKRTESSSNAAEIHRLAVLSQRTVLRRYAMTRRIPLGRVAFTARRAIASSFLLVCLFSSAFAQAVLQPDKIQIGKISDLTIKLSDCVNCTLKGAKVETLDDGSGISVKDWAVLSDNKSMTLKVDATSADARLGQTSLKLTYKKGNDDVVMLLPLAVIFKSRGPTPGGIDAVDVMWAVVPNKIVIDNFGRWVNRKYYCIEVVIGNNSGFDVQIVGAGFRLANGQPMSYAGNKVTIPNTSYRMPRGTIEKEQIAGARAYFIDTVKALGPVLTGFAPFAGKSWPQGVNIFSDPFEKGLEAVIKDRTITELNHLDQEILRDGLIVHNNVMVRSLVFFPRDFLKIDSKVDRNDPQTVMQALGALVIVGDEILHLNREVVVASNEGGPQPIDPSVTDVTAAEITDQNLLTNMKVDTSSLKAYDVFVTGSTLTGAEVASTAGENVTVMGKPDIQSDARMKVTISAPKDSKIVSLTLGRPGGGAAGVTVMVKLTKKPQ